MAASPDQLDNRMLCRLRLNTTGFNAGLGEL
jgi:hypothetical protein